MTHTIRALSEAVKFLLSDPKDPRVPQFARLLAAIEMAEQEDRYEKMGRNL